MYEVSPLERLIEVLYDLMYFSRLYETPLYYWIKCAFDLPLGIKGSSSGIIVSNMYSKSGYFCTKKLKGLVN